MQACGATVQFGGYMRWDALQAEAAVSIIRHDLMDYLARQAVPQAPGSGTYCKFSRGELQISAMTVSDHVQRLCMLLGSAGQPVCKTATNGRTNRTYFISGVEKSLGTPAGAPPKVTARHIELDVGDVRVRLKRRSQSGPWRNSLDAMRAIRHAGRSET